MPVLTLCSGKSNQRQQSTIFDQKKYKKSPRWIFTSVWLTIVCQNVKFYLYSGDDNIAMLEKAVPGVPGQDYPIYAEVPDTSFSCLGQVDGGYYADPEAECQVFHICTNDGQGGLSKYSFLCPNGTVIYTIK